MSVDQKQNVVLRTLEQERHDLDKANIFKKKDEDAKKSSSSSTSDESSSESETGKVFFFFLPSQDIHQYGINLEIVIKILTIH